MSETFRDINTVEGDDLFTSGYQVNVVQGGVWLVPQTMPLMYTIHSIYLRKHPSNKPPNCQKKPLKNIWPSYIWLIVQPKFSSKWPNQYAFCPVINISITYIQSQYPQFYGQYTWQIIYYPFV